MENFLVRFALNIHLFFDTRLFVYTGIAIVIYMLLRKKFGFLKLFLISLATTELIILGLKNILQIPRPTDALISVSGYGMPSGHAGISFFVATFFTYYVFKSNEGYLPKFFSVAVLIFTAIMITASRVILHVHTIDQVALGAIIGIISPIIFLKTLKH